ncbi:MAG: AMP-binding protein [Acidimicrobiaceae bacterium]|nr:AMP-binding protein [Acidimicrobiaceae bacterium]
MFLSVTASYSQGSTDRPLLAETIGKNLDNTSKRFPDRQALVSVAQNVALTYREFNDEVNKLARALVAHGFKKGERVGIWSPNTLEWAIIQYATARVGIILVNINPAYRSSELSYVLKQSGCKAIFSITKHKTSDYQAMVDEVRSEIPELELALYTDTADYKSWIENYYQNVSQEAIDEIQKGLDFDDPINIQYTSGTTGFPKGATLSHFNLLNNGYFVGEGCGYSEIDRVCIPVPYYHCFGMVMGNLAVTSHGATAVLPSASFDPAEALAAVEKERCTSLYGVPTMFIAELALENFDSYDLSSLRTGIMAGSPCPAEVMKKVQSLMHMEQVTICYGMTETSPVSMQTKLDDPLDKRVSTVGPVHPHVEVKIVDPSGHVIERGQIGEFLTRGYSVMLGYWNEPEKTQQAIDAARWMHTGDLGVMDEDGYVNIVGRIKDMIIRGGENVYPREIEEFLFSHPDIVDASVIGVPDPKFGEEIAAWIKIKPGSNLTEDAIKEYCKGKIAHYKIPRYVKITDSFPMTVTGKIQKYIMRQQSVEELSLSS